MILKSFQQIMFSYYVIFILYSSIFIQKLILPYFKEEQGKKGSFKGYKLMTSVSIPVYNKKNHTVGLFDILK